MAAITITKVNLLGTETRPKNTRAKVASVQPGYAVVPFIVNSGNTGSSGTDTFTLTLNYRTVFVIVSMYSSTGTITRSNFVLQSTDTVGIPLPPLVAGGSYHTGIIPVSGGETLVLTTGTLATAASTIIVHEFGGRGVPLNGFV